MKSYQDLLQHVLNHGEQHADRTKVGTISVFGYQWRHDLMSGFPLLTTKRVPFRWIFEELRWFLSGDTNEANLRAAGVDIWKEWADLEHTSKFDREEGDLGPVYGYLWRSFGGDYPIFNGVDQIARLVNELVTNPGSRRHIVSGWDPASCDKVELPPCHTLWQCKVHHDNSLSLSLYARSIDSFLGLPFNIASYALLTNLLAHVTGRSVRDLVISFGDLHIYKNHLDAVHEQLGRVPLPLPKLWIDPKFYGGGMDALLSITYKDVQMIGYNSHGKIEAEVAV